MCIVPARLCATIEHAEERARVRLPDGRTVFVYLGTDGKVSVFLEGKKGELVAPVEESYA